MVHHENNNYNDDKNYNNDSNNDNDDNNKNDNNNDKMTIKAILQIIERRDLITISFGPT